MAFRNIAFDVDLILQVAERDESIAKVLREICALDGAARRAALDLVGMHLGRRTSRDVLECIEALRGDDLAHRLAARLGPST
ncbi:MAG: hypothetical protein ACREKS_21130 [Candidatus Rokuibacteriota bacterium]